jgi:hypothetical protein
MVTCVVCCNHVKRVKEEKVKERQIEKKGARNYKDFFIPAFFFFLQPLATKSAIGVWNFRVFFESLRARPENGQLKPRRSFPSAGLSLGMNLHVTRWQ